MSRLMDRYREYKEQCRDAGDWLVSNGVCNLSSGEPARTKWSMRPGDEDDDSE